MGARILKRSFKRRDDEEGLIAWGSLKVETAFFSTLIEDLCEEINLQVFDLAELSLHGGRYDVELGLERADGANSITGIAEIATEVKSEVEFL